MEAMSEEGFWALIQRTKGDSERVTAELKKLGPERTREFSDIYWTKHPFRGVQESTRRIGARQISGNCGGLSTRVAYLTDDFIRSLVSEHRVFDANVRARAEILLLEVVHHYSRTLRRERQCGRRADP